MTTNAGSGRAATPLGFTASDKVAEQGKIEKALLEFLRPEFINRVDEIVVFNSLTVEDFASIVKIMLSDLSDLLADRNIAFSYTDAAKHLIAAESHSVKYGARNMRRYIQRNIEDPIAEAIISDSNGTITKIHLSVKEGKLFIDCK
jgi:ATP-dependent Clp protease ATP-binding subunit ClpA